MAVLKMQCPMCDEEENLVKRGWEWTRLATATGGGRVLYPSPTERPRITCRNCGWAGFLALTTDKVI